MGFKRSCLLMQSRFSPMLLFLLSLNFTLLLVALFSAISKEKGKQENTSDNVEIGSVCSSSFGWCWFFCFLHVLYLSHLFCQCVFWQGRGLPYVYGTWHPWVGLGGGTRWVTSSWTNTGCLWLHLYQVGGFTKFLWVWCGLPIGLTRLSTCEGHAGTRGTANVVLAVNKNKAPNRGVKF